MSGGIGLRTWGVAVRLLTLAAVCSAVSCGPGLKQVRRPDISPGKLPEYARTYFLERVAAKDVRAVADMLHAPFGYNGIWFSDPACTRQFPQPALIDADRIEAFARCVTTLTLRDPKPTKLGDVAVYEYGDGIELEVRFSFVRYEVGVLRMGYSNRGTASDMLPTITTAAIEAHRIAGTAAGQLTDEARATLRADALAEGVKHASAWMKLCLDAAGNVSGVHFAWATPPSAADLFGAAIADWKFRPFEVAGAAIPVCAHVGISDPLTELGPRPLDTGDPKPYIELGALKRIAGNTKIAPDDDEKRLFQRVGGGMLFGTISVCIKEDGTVGRVTMIESTGLPGYDASIQRVPLAWRYEPVSYKGKPLSICTQVTFIYTQK